MGIATPGTAQHFPQARLEGPLVPAYVELEGDRLYWTWFIDPRTAAPVNYPISAETVWRQVLKEGRSRIHRWEAPQQARTRGMLDAFVRIEDGHDVEEFARRYGALELCVHGYPTAFHEQVDEGCDSPSQRVKEGAWAFWERIDRWLFYARQARAILNLAESVRAGRPTLETDWRTATIIGNYEAASEEEQWSELALAVDNWYRWGGVRPVLTWIGAGLSPILVGGTTGGTFGALAVQLMLAVSNSSLALCDGCALPYTPGRRVRADRRNYCETCRESGIPWRDAKRDQRSRVGRARKKEAGDVEKR